MKKLAARDFEDILQVGLLFSFAMPQTANAAPPWRPVFNSCI